MKRYRSLPSEAEGPAQRGLKGFQAVPNAEHLEKSATALRRLAQVINAAGPPGRAKQIQFGHVVNSGMLSLLLYGFPLREVDHDYHAIDASDPGVPIRFAIVANQPVAVQIENAISFLAAFIRRQENIAQLLATENYTGVRDVDRAVMDSDNLAQEDVVDDLAAGWETAARRVAARAADIGLHFEVTYQTDLLPTREQVAARAPIVRSIYNTFKDLRYAIDVTVSIVAGHEPQIVQRNPGLGQEGLRNYLQQQTAASSLTRYLNHAVRDGFVCGNGYFLIRKDEPFSFYNLRPEEAVILGPDRFGIAGANDVRELGDRGIHFRGLHQIASPYGLSIFEVFVSDLILQRALTDGIKDLERIAGATPSETQSRAIQDLRDQAGRIESKRTQRLEQILTVPVRDLPPPEGALYFPGFERY